jgi:UDP-3-O-acyl N-acetylglucosamine deacetylase
MLFQRPQRTLARPAEVRGVGYLTGANVCLRFLPAPPGAGVAFVRTDLTPPAKIPARFPLVTGTNRRTTLGHFPRCVTLVEHVLAALAGLRIDNCQIEVGALEPPGLDGSAQQFVDALQAAGIQQQAAARAVWTVRTSVLVSQGGATLTLHPSEAGELRISYFLNYGDFSPLGRQTSTAVITPEGFANDLACTRTFLLEAEANELRRQGVGKRTRVSDLLVFGRRGPLENRLRFADEPARHKILDLVGDLSLLGEDVRGHLVAYRSGHPLNAALVRALAQRLEERQPARRLAA